MLIDSNVAYNKDGSFGHTRCFIRDDTARKIRDARSELLLEETERVCDLYFPDFWLALSVSIRELLSHYIFLSFKSAIESSYA